MGFLKPEDGASHNPDKPVLVRTGFLDIVRTAKPFIVGAASVT
jgi:hypothetical protein